MIPRLKPWLGMNEISVLLRRTPDAVRKFESDFARKFSATSAIAFPYGRSALWAFFNAMGIENAEIIMPAYTCSVVAHAILLSQNRPRFVDINLTDYNMDLDQIESVIGPNTRAVVATHLFGYPLDVNKLSEIVKRGEKKFGKKIWIIQDCAHSFGADFHGQSVVNTPDLALYGLNISKQITSIFGGMITTNNEGLAQKLRTWRDNHFHSASWVKTLRRSLYLLAVYPAFNPVIYGFIYWLQSQTSLLNYLTRSYHLDDKVEFPPGYNEFMLPVEARVGLVQINKYDQIIQNRQNTAEYYSKMLIQHTNWAMPPLVEGATYSHYVIRVPDRQKVLKSAASRGVQLGELIEYCIPELPAYRQFAGDAQYPNASLASRSTINLPIFASLSEKEKARIMKIINELG